MEQGETLNRRIEKGMQEQVQELIRKYDPGPVFEDWVSEFKTGFKRYKWNSAMAVDQAVGDCLFWIECLLKTWREEVGPSGKKTKFPGRKKPVSGRTSVCPGDGVPSIPLLRL